jgi:hypothetical protein
VSETTATPTPPPRRAQLELLVRREDEGFDVRQIGSATAFVQSRPQRVAAESWELAEVASRVAGQRSFFLKNTTTDRFLLLTEPEKFLWEQMDGRTSLQDIATAYVLRYGAFDFDIIPALIRKLQRAHLLTLTPTSRLRQALARNRRIPVAKALEIGLTALERTASSCGCTASAASSFSPAPRWSRASCWASPVCGRARSCGARPTRWSRASAATRSRPSSP